MHDHAQTNVACWLTSQQCTLSLKRVCCLSCGLCCAMPGTCLTACSMQSSSLRCRTRCCARIGLLSVAFYLLTSSTCNRDQTVLLVSVNVLDFFTYPSCLIGVTRQLVILTGGLKKWDMIQETCCILAHNRRHCIHLRVLTAALGDSLTHLTIGPVGVLHTGSSCGFHSSPDAPSNDSSWGKYRNSGASSSLILVLHLHCRASLLI